MLKQHVPGPLVGAVITILALYALGYARLTWEWFRERRETRRMLKRRVP